MFYVGNIIVVTLIIYLSIVYTIYSGIDMVISSKDIKGYSSPDDKSADIAQFAQNTILFIESTGANYIKVKDSGGISGWVSKDNIIEITTVQEKF
jgi:SH3-like domain-containing protein